MRAEPWQRALAWTVWAYFVAFAVIAMVWRPLGLQWDFLVFYDAAHAWRLGLDPYDLAKLEAFGQRAGSLNFNYLPLLAPVFAPFTFLAPNVALALWLACKLLVLWLLVRCWNSFETIDWKRGTTLLFLLLAFNGTVAWDLVSGNISLVQQLCLWGGIYCLLRGRPLVFVAGVLVAACFKIMPLAFLGLLVLLPRRRNLAWFALGVGAFALFFLANQWMMHDEYLRFVSEVRQRVAMESGVLAPSSFALACDIARTLHSISTLPFLQDDFVLSILPLLLYVGFVFGLLGFCLISWRKMDSFGRGVDEKLAIYFFMATYVLVMPRVKCYDYILLVPAALHLVRSARPEWRYLLAFAFCIPLTLPGNDLQASITTSPFLGPVHKLFRLAYEYWPLVCAGVVWVSLLREIQLRQGGESATGGWRASVDDGGG